MEGWLSRRWCDVAKAEIRTRNLPLLQIRHSTTQPLAHQVIVVVVIVAAAAAAAAVKII